MSSGPTPKDKKLEHAEDLERMSRILERRSEEAKASKKEPARKDDQMIRQSATEFNPCTSIGRIRVA